MYEKSVVGLNDDFTLINDFIGALEPRHDIRNINFGDSIVSIAH